MAEQRATAAKLADLEREMANLLAHATGRNITVLREWIDEDDETGILRIEFSQAEAGHRERGFDHAIKHWREPVEVDVSGHIGADLPEVQAAIKESGVPLGEPEELPEEDGEDNDS